MNGKRYVDSLKIRLDSMRDQNEIQRIIINAVKELRDQGYTDEDILKFFSSDHIYEAQDNSNMIYNHQKYIEMVKKILGGKNK